MKYLIPLILLCGCTTAVPVKRTFPEAPAEMLVVCPQLAKLKEDAKLSDVAKNIVDNYTLYHECSLKQEAWIEWYSSQKKIFEDVK